MPVHAVCGARAMGSGLSRRAHAVQYHCGMSVLAARSLATEAPFRDCHEFARRVYCIPC